MSAMCIRTILQLRPGILNCNAEKNVLLYTWFTIYSTQARFKICICRFEKQGGEVSGKDKIGIFRTPYLDPSVRQKKYII